MHINFKMQMSITIAYILCKIVKLWQTFTHKVEISHTKINKKQTIGLLNTMEFAEFGNQLSH